MKKLLLFVTIFLLASILVLAIPSAAFAHNEPTGERINIFFSGTAEFPAATPFYIRHGWVQPSDDEAIGIFDFQLEVDGVFQKEDFKTFSADSGNPDWLSRIWVFNFPSGMTGTHTFTGHWYAPCQYAVNWLGYPGPCATPNLKVETSTRVLVVTFLDPAP